MEFDQSTKLQEHAPLNGMFQFQVCIVHWPVLQLLHGNPKIIQLIFSARRLDMRNFTLFLLLLFFFFCNFCTLDFKTTAVDCKRLKYESDTFVKFVECFQV